MLRLALFAILVSTATAGQLTELVDCYGSRTSTSLTLGPPLFDFPNAASIGCGDGITLEADAHARLFTFVTAAVDSDPNRPPRLQRGGLSANLDFEGVFMLSFPDPVKAAFWSACVTSSLTQYGGGNGYAAGFYGPYSIGAPCDFAHALPANPTNFVPVILSLGVQGSFVSQVVINLQTFDAAGNPTPPGFFYFFAAGDVPEPPSSVLLLVPLAAIALRARGAGRQRSIPAICPVKRPNF